MPGAGATEMELARELASLGEVRAGRLRPGSHYARPAQKSPGLDQYSIKKYAEAFEVIPMTLAENAGLDGTEVISKLYAAHQAGRKTVGVDVESEDNNVVDAAQQGILDAYLAKQWAIRYATDAAITVLRVDQVCAARREGGTGSRGTLWPDHHEQAGRGAQA